jgi:hypothetical protein
VRVEARARSRPDRANLDRHEADSIPVGQIGAKGAAPSRQFLACADRSAESPIPSWPAKLLIISGTQAIREIERNLL